MLLMPISRQVVANMNITYSIWQGSLMKGHGFTATSMKEIVKETFSIVEKLAAIPTENPVSVRSNNPFKKTVTREQEIENLINKFKNK